MIKIRLETLQSIISKLPDVNESKLPQYVYVMGEKVLNIDEVGAILNKNTFSNTYTIIKLTFERDYGLEGWEWILII